MQNAGSDRDVAAMAVLGDVQRRRLYEILLRAPRALSRDQLAAEAEIPRSTVTFHLAKLSDAGLLESEYRKLSERSGPGSGRPTRLYRAVGGEVSASVPERNYALAATVLASAIEEAAGTGSTVEAAVLEVATRAGMQLGTAADSMAEVLDASGYAPEPDGAGGYRLANCPFHQLARSHRQLVCALNGALLSGALSACPDAGLAVLPEGEKGYCCARLAPIPAVDGLG